jgi:hypothetical protein
MNERGVLTSVSGDLRTTLVHEYKPYINDLRNNERIDYSKASNLNDRNGANNNNNNTSPENDMRHVEQQQDQKPYSTPSTPPTPMSISDQQINESKVNIY